MEQNYIYMFQNQSFPQLQRLHGDKYWIEVPQNPVSLNKINLFILKNIYLYYYIKLTHNRYSHFNTKYQCNTHNLSNQFTLLGFKYKISNLRLSQKLSHYNIKNQQLLKINIYNYTIRDHASFVKKYCKYTIIEIKQIVG